MTTYMTASHFLLWLGLGLLERSALTADTVSA